MAQQNLSLFSGLNRVEAPFIKVQIGTYTFGVYQKSAAETDENGFYTAAKIVYPNYVKRLTIQKINGQVNQYTLEFVYPITPGDDPNFFEKVFSSVSKSRKIVFSYGDAQLPQYVYKNEEAIITNIQSQFIIKSSTIAYTVSAVSRCVLAKSGCDTFIHQGKVKPSDEIKRLLYNKKYGLLDVFSGMRDKASVELAGLIPGDDQEVYLDDKVNISPLEYLSYLVSCMIPAGSSANNNKQNTFYILSIVDLLSGDINVGKLTIDQLGGPFFKITRVSSQIKNSEAFDLDIGFPSQNIVTQFSITNSDSYSIFYNWQEELNPTDYVERINVDGMWEDVYAPTISSKNDKFITRVSDATWWSKLTEFPISAIITIKGLLRPAILMNYLRLNVFYYGKKHIASGLYIITKQIDTIDDNGYRTQLTVTRVGGAE